MAVKKDGRVQFHQHSFTRSFLRIKPNSLKGLSNPALIVGLPGIGLVSKLAADNMVRVLKARRFAVIYSPHFPNQVLARKNGRLKLFAMHLYRARIGKRDVVILKGDLQPLTVEGQYEVAARVLTYFKELGGSDVIAMAGYAINAIKPKPVIYASATSEKLYKKFSALGAKPVPAIVPIVGMAGMLPALGKLYGVEGACLLVETPGPVVDPNGAKALTDLIAKYLGGKVDCSKLVEGVKKASGMMAEFERQSKEGPGAPPVFPQMPKDVSYIR